MKITKHTTTTYELLQVFAYESIYGSFKESRLRHGLSISRFEKCFACNHHFTEDESVYLGCVKVKGNFFFCKSCAEKYNTEKEEEAQNA